MEKFKLFDGREYTSIESPICVFFEITNRCNLNCFYCFSNDNILLKDHHLKALNINQIKDILDDLASNHVKLVEFSGGEPLVVKQFVDLVKYARSLGLNVSFVSNGTLFKDETCAELKGYLDHINITLRGYNSETHDKVTGVKGSYEKTLNAIKLLNKYDIGVGVMLDPTYLNYRQIEDCISDLFLREKVNLKNLFLNRINIRNRENQGDAKDEYCLRTIEEYELVFEQMERLNQKFGLIVEVVDGFPLCQVNPRYHKFMTRCNYGLTHAGIDFEGNLKMCPCSSQVIGSLLEKSIRDLWTNSPVIRDYRKLEWMDDKCKRCQDFEKCGGGCWTSQPETKSYQMDYFFGSYRFDDSFVPKLTSTIMIKPNEGCYILLSQRKVPRPLPVKHYYGDKEVFKITPLEKQFIELIDGKRSVGAIKGIVMEVNPDYVKNIPKYSDTIDNCLVALRNSQLIN